MRVLKVENVVKYYGSKNNVTKALSDVSFEVQAGEYVGVMGASGSGKTTLLNCVSTIDTVTSGHIYVGDQDVTALKAKDLAKFRREELGYVFQDFNLLDTLTAFENVALALTITRESPTRIEEKVKVVAKLLGIAEILHRFPSQLSGGEKQRVAAARAVITKPKLILADEPTGALDSKSARLLLECLQKLVHELSASILMVTHDAFSASYCDRILFIKDGKLFSQLNKGLCSRKEFFDKIIEVIALLGGDHDVF